MSEAPEGPTASEVLDDEASLREQFVDLREQLSKLTPAQLKDGTWFQVVLQKTAGRMLRKQHLECLLDRWRIAAGDVTDAALATFIIKQTARRCAMVGGVAGGMVSAAALASTVSLGLPISGALLIAVAEMALVERIQLRMIFALAELKGYPLNPDDMGDVGMLYGEVLRVKGATRAHSRPEAKD